MVTSSGLVVSSAATIPAKVAARIEVESLIVGELPMVEGQGPAGIK